MRFKLLLALYLSSLIMFISCSDDDDDNPVSSQQITGSGTLVTEERTLPAFHSVSFTPVGNVHLQSDTAQVVSITVDDNIMPIVLTNVVNGVLIIGTNPAYNITNYELYVRLSMTDLVGVTLAGVGEISSLNSFSSNNVNVTLAGVGNIAMGVQTDRLNCLMSGVGDVTLGGSADHLMLQHSAVGNFQSYDMSTDTTLAILSGVGNAYVNVSDTLDVVISGAGSLYYRGDPAIHQTITGTGAVVNGN